MTEGFKAAPATCTHHDLLQAGYSKHTTLWACGMFCLPWLLAAGQL